MSTVVAYLERDLRVAWSYRSSFFLQYLGMPFALVGTRFVADLVGPREALAQYGGDYFAFALIGAALQTVLYPALTVFRGAVREAQTLGTFEAILMTRARAEVTVLASGLYALLQVAVQPLVVIPLIGFALGARFQWSHALPAVGVLALTVMAFAGLGLCSAAFTIAFKQTEPFTMAVISSTTLLSGVVFPIDLLPAPLRAASQLLPLTHAAEALRGTFIEGAHVTGFGWHLGALGVFALVLPVGLFAVSRALEWTRRNGTLAQY
ncbi:MAG: ABC transporter permease [Dehalococcoidia bacterium]